MNLDFFHRTAIEWIVPGVFFGAVLLELFFLLVFYLRLMFLKKSSERVLKNPISICLSVRNEEERIGRILGQLMEQQYEDFEVVVVDDFSEDCTLQKIAQLAKKYPRIKFTSISQETLFSEKISINLALKAVSFDRVVFVRPDSCQIDSQFLKKINDNTDGSNLLISYTNFSRERKFYNKFCRMERFLSFLSSAAYSRFGLVVFYEEANVLFMKDIYFESMGFRGKMNNHFANLELVFNAVCKKGIKISIDQETFIRENTQVQKRDFTELMKKKIRLKQDLGFGKRLILLLEDLSKILFMGSFIWLLAVKPNNWLFVVLPALLIFILHFFIVKTMAARLKEEKIFISSFMYVFVRPVVNLFHATKIYIHDKRN